MLPIKTITALLAFTVILSIGCKKTDTNANTALLQLSPDEITGKSGNNITTTLTITSFEGAKDIVIYKTVNLKRDSSYGQGVGGTKTVVPDSLGNNKYRYNFSYNLQDTEIDQLVGFNFHFVDNTGASAEKDLTVHTTTSGRTIIYSHTWKLVTRLWTSVTPNVEDEKPCELDNTFKWNKDSTYIVNFGANTGSAGCDYDGFNVPQKWNLSEDEKTFTQVYSSLFDPSNVTTETYTVQQLTSSKFVIEQLIDLTVFGLTDHEKFVSTYVPVQ